MFAPPFDHGIAQPDRAVTNVKHGTRAHLEGGVGDSNEQYWWQGGGPATDVAVQNITIYPPTRGQKTQGDPFEPIKIGILIDMDLNQLLADWIDPTILAIEDAMNEGVWRRSPVQLVVADARGLPRENYRKLIKGYEWRRLRRCPRPDDLGQLSFTSGHRQSPRRTLHWLDWCAQVRFGVLLHCRQWRCRH